MSSLRLVFMTGLLSLLLFAYCGNSNPTAEENPMPLDKTNIRAMLDQDQLIINIPSKLLSEQKSNGKIRLQILDEKDDVIAAKTTTIDVDPKDEVVSVKLDCEIPIEDLVWHRLAYVYDYADQKTDNIINLSRVIEQIEMRVLGQSEFYAGGPASIRLIVLNHADQSPLADADVELKLHQAGKLVKNLFLGKTNSGGTIDAEFELSNKLDEGGYQLEIIAKTKTGQDRLLQEIHIKRGYKIMLTTDKPLYQPGQLIHIRSLTLQKPTNNAVGNTEIRIEVEDAKGNKVFKKKQETDEFGIAAADFRLADEINMGTYKITAHIGTATAEKSVNIERYVLPKFNVTFSTEKDFYLPGDKLSGEVTARYFFGKPVNGDVEIIFSKFDVGFEEFARMNGKINEGVYQFEMELPTYFVGQPLEQGDAFVQVTAKVTDSAEHEQEKFATVPIVKNPLSIVVVPESGQLAPNLDNKIYLMTSYPDGSPAKTNLTITATGGAISPLKGNAGPKPLLVETDESGIVAINATPTAEQLVLEIKAVDPQGQTGRITFNSEWMNTGLTSILVRPDQALYKVGDTMNLSIFASNKRGTIFIDFIKDRQTVLTKSTQLEGGAAEFAFDLPPELDGSIRVQAYTITPDGNIVRDSRLVYVSAADDLTIEIAKKMGRKDDEGTIYYHPGTDVELEFSVTDQKGHGVLAALGVQIVDEAVFALSEMQPGLEKVYFRLEEEIMQPRYEIHGFTPRDLVDVGHLEDGLHLKRQQAATILLASAGELDAWMLDVNTYTAREQVIRQKAQEAFQHRVNKITEALSEYSKKYNRVPDQKEGLAKLIVEGLLTQKDLLDPWGNALKFDFYSEVLNYFGVHSWGPDEVEGSGDDLYIEAYVEWLGDEKSTFFDKWFSWIGWGRGKGDVMMLKAIPPMAAGAMRNEAFMVMEMADAPMDALEKDAEGTGPGSGDEVRVRKYFPETLLNVPSLITDKNGKATLNFKIADSITDWRITSMGNSQTGQLGSLTAGLRCFQDFFIDIDLPVSLTQNDWVSIPVAVYNYLPHTQEVRLKMEMADWFEYTGAFPHNKGGVNGDAEKTLTIESNAVDVVYFPIRVKKIGSHALTVYGYGEKMNDAIERTIEVIPDGKEFLVNIDNRVEATQDGTGTGHVKQTITIPAASIDEASKIFVKVYPGVFSQLVEGLDAIFQMPFGCFEQTTSTTYPNILALDYLRTTGASMPEVEMKALEYINLGYQRLLSFEVNGGGFEWFGNDPANQLLTAYGLMEFYDMNNVYEIDPNVIQRTQNWLINKQTADGSWGPDAQYYHLESWGTMKDSNLMITAYVMWSLLDSGYQGPGLEKGLAYIRDHLAEADDPYVLAIVANALVAADKKHESTNQIFDKLMTKKVEKDNQIWWETAMNTAYYSHGNSAHLETTAMIAQALLKWGQASQTTNKVLNYIVGQKSPNGIWASTQGTIMSLKALLMSVSTASDDIAADVDVIINGEAIQTLKITPEDADVLRLVDLKNQTKEGDNSVELIFKGNGNLMYSLVGRYYLPWTDPDVQAQVDLLSIDVKYDKTELEKDDVITASVLVKNNRPGQADMVIIDLGIPPGFEVMAGDLNEIVGTQNIQKYNQTGRQIIIYLDKLDSAHPVSFSYRLKAKYPITAQTRTSKVYEYYNPEIQSLVEPEELKVN